MTKDLWQHKPLKVFDKAESQQTFCSANRLHQKSVCEMCINGKLIATLEVLKTGATYLSYTKR